METDASDFALAGTLTQRGHPVAFFARTLHGPETRHVAVEKEAAAIVESLDHWRHYLAGRHFTLITDQRSVSYMFDNRRRGKIKNEKIQRWRMELSCFNYDIIYRPGKNNLAADTLTRAFCNAINLDALSSIHEALCHPGVVRLAHFVRTRNLPYSMNDVKRVCSSCTACAKLKPNFYRPEEVNLVKATQPWERISLDFKGPLKSSTRNTFFLTVVDEYSRFPFAFPCTDVSASTVFKYLAHLFSIFGLPGYVHSDRGSGFMSKELRGYLSGLGVATSRTTPYNPRGNGQCERYNGIIWKATLLALHTKGLPLEQWECVFLDALHSIRSLLSTATNVTPHERFLCFQRRSTTGKAIPTWLATPGPVLLRRFVRQSKSEPLVDEVELVEANPHYAHIKFPNGREDTVSIRDLAPIGQELSGEPQTDHVPTVEVPPTPLTRKNN